MSAIWQRNQNGSHIRGDYYSKLRYY